MFKQGSIYVYRSDVAGPEKPTYVPRESRLDSKTEKLRKEQFLCSYSGLTGLQIGEIVLVINQHNRSQGKESELLKKIDELASTKHLS